MKQKGICKKLAMHFERTVGSDAVSTCKALSVLLINDKRLEALSHAQPKMSHFWAKNVTLLGQKDNKLGLLEL